MDTKEEVLENLVYVDQFIKKSFPNLNNLELILVGGASFLLKGLSSDYTLDVDNISQVDTDVMEFLNDFSINDAALEVIKISPSYRERMEKLEVDFNVLNVYLVSNEDLIITKLGRSGRKDLEVLKKSGILNCVNVSLLTQLAEEVSAKDSKFQKNWEYFKQTMLRG
jgi:hypothetical protein